MAHVVVFMFADLGAPLSSTIFATDAMGANERDHGGFGIVGREVSNELVRACLVVGERPGFTVARLNGDLSGLRNPEKEIRATIPFTRLPKELFEKEEEWIDIAAGRWAYPDHITLGEARAVVRLLELLAREPASHRHKVLSLQDNRPTSGSMTKGRSPSFPLNYLLRKRAALCLASRIKLILPWLESERQPADELSRNY